MEFDQRLLLLGTLQAERAGQGVQGFESRRAQALLGYLAALGRPQTRDHLADFFWPEKSQTRGHGNLSRVLHNFKVLLPGCVVATRNNVTFDSQVCWLDTHAFTKLSQLTPELDAGALQEAVSLYRDEFMAGICLDDCREFERWLVAERIHWDQKIAEVLYRLVAYYLEQGEVAAGLREADRLLAIAPWREKAHYQKMILLVLSGQRSPAIKQYAQCRQIMEDELNSTTAPETDALYQRILAGEPCDQAALPRR